MDVEEVIVKEKVVRITELPEARLMEVSIALINKDDVVIKEDSLEIIGADYELLFSESTEFDEGKQQGSYREVDLWKMIDKVSNQ